MHKLRLLFCCFILFTFFIIPLSFSYTDSMYIWSNYPDTVTTSSIDTSSTPVDLALESGSAILIEQTARKNSL